MQLVFKKEFIKDCELLDQALPALSFMKKGKRLIDMINEQLEKDMQLPNPTYIINHAFVFGNYGPFSDNALLGKNKARCLSDHVTIGPVGISLRHFEIHKDQTENWDEFWGYWRTVTRLRLQAEGKL